MAVQETVDVVLAGGWRLAARAVDPEHAVEVRLHPFHGEPLMPCGVAATPATLEWRSEHGLVRREGALHHDGESLVLAVAREAVVMQRRQYTRIHVAVAVDVVGAGDPVMTKTVDLSVGGMLIERADGLKVDDRVELTLHLPGRHPVSGCGVVRRATEFGHVAFEFVQLDDGGRDELVAFLAERN